MLNTKPPGSKTEHSNPKCYARSLKDCDDEITLEHYISKKLLERLGDFESEGLAWLKEKRALPARALQSKVLCKRHNNALSDLDNNITELYDLLRRWQDRSVVGDLVLDGEDLERWAIKVMFGLFASGSAVVNNANGDAVSRTSEIPKKHLKYLFGDGASPTWAGFYFAHSVFEELRPVSVRCRLEHLRGRATPERIAFSLVGFTWMTTLSKPAPRPHIYRPSDFDIGKAGHLTLHWNGARRLVSWNSGQYNAATNDRIQLFEVDDQRP
jgi:hypothetical protein